MDGAAGSPPPPSHFLGSGSGGILCFNQAHLSAAMPPWWMAWRNTCNGKLSAMLCVRQSSCSLPQSMIGNRGTGKLRRAPPHFLQHFHPVNYCITPLSLICIWGGGGVTLVCWCADTAEQCSLSGQLLHCACCTTEQQERESCFSPLDRHHVGLIERCLFTPSLTIHFVLWEAPKAQFNLFTHSLSCCCLRGLNCCCTQSRSCNYYK